MISTRNRVEVVHDVTIEEYDECSERHHEELMYEIRECNQHRTYFNKCLGS